MSKEFFCRERDVYQAWIWDGTFKDAPEWVTDKVKSGDIYEGKGWEEGDYPGERVLLYSDGFWRNDGEDEPEICEMGLGDILKVAFTGGGNPQFLSHCPAREFLSRYEVVDGRNVEDRTRNIDDGYPGYYAKDSSKNLQSSSEETDFLKDQNKALQTRVRQQGKALDFLLKHVSKNLEHSREILSAFGVKESEGDEEDEDLSEE
jgi:hypothetical protein